MKCESCGRELAGNEKFCQGCGSPVPVQNNNVQANNVVNQPVNNQMGQGFNQQPNVYAQNQMYNNPEPKKSKVGLIIALVLLVVAVVGAGGYAIYYFTQSDDTEEKDNDDKKDDKDEKEDDDEKEEDNEKEDDDDNNTSSGSRRLTCEQSASESGMNVEMKINFEFNKSLDRIENADMSMVLELTDEEYSEAFDIYKELYAEICEEDDAPSNCTVNETSNRVEITASGTAEEMGEDPDMTKDEIIESYELEGFTCK